MSSETAIREVETEEGERRPYRGARRLVGALARGLPNHWFPILASAELGTSPMHVKRFGEELAVWRDSAGHPRVVQDRCSHRGTSLSLGTVRADAISCRYHGWTFDTSGACIDIPTGEALGDRLLSLKQRARLKTYRAEDRAGYIWAYYGDPTQATALSVVPYELEDARWSVFRHEYIWKTNWLNILDNILDPLHALFVHVGVATQLRRAQLSQFEISEDFEEGFHLAKRGALVDGKMGEETHVEFLLPSVFRVDLADGTPRGVFRVIMIPTPIDEQSTFLCYFQLRRVSGWARLRWHFQWWTKYRKAQELIKSQDQVILDSLGPIEETRLHENLAYSDIGVVHLRRRLTQAFERNATIQRKVRGKSFYAPWESEP